MPTDPSWRVLLLIVLSALIWAWYRRQYPQSSPGAVRIASREMSLLTGYLPHE